MTNRDSGHAISVRELSKGFKMYAKPSDMLRELISGKPRHRLFWALRDISFDVAWGEVVGLVGKNGSGKSTLLKIIAGTLDRTAGQTKINGKVSAILELGSGFNPEYTGLENIYMGGLCLGMTREEIDRKVEWIIDFSELGHVMDQPFRTYSSGMQARLTFSTAVSVEPDILLIDEALAVGDAKFQSKCFAKLEDFRSKGTTILFVSHELNSVKLLCDRAIYLDNGMLIDMGNTKRVCDLYHKTLFVKEEQTVRSARIRSETISIPDADEDGHNDGANSDSRLKEAIAEKLKVNCVDPSEWKNDVAEFLDFGILDENGRRTVLLEAGKGYTFFSTMLFYQDRDNILLGIKIRNGKGMDVFVINTYNQGVPVPPQKRGDVLRSYVDVRMWLAPGEYFLGFGAVNYPAERQSIYDNRVDAIHFSVVGRNCLLDTGSIVNLEPGWSFDGISLREGPSGVLMDQAPTPKNGCS